MDGVHRAYALGLRYRNDEKKNITSQKSTILHSTNFLLSLAVWPQWLAGKFEKSQLSQLRTNPSERGLRIETRTAQVPRAGYAFLQRSCERDDVHDERRRV